MMWMDEDDEKSIYETMEMDPNIQDAQPLMVAKQNGNASMVIGSTRSYS